MVQDFEDGAWRINDFLDYIWDNVAQTALNQAERMALGSRPSSMLVRAAKNLRITDNDIAGGEIAEILLYAIMRNYYNALPVVPKIYYKQNVNDYAKGADSVHIVLEPGDKFSLWLGEAKFYDSIDDTRLTSIVTSVYNRISLDGAAISIQHVRLDENERYVSNVSSKLNNCLTLEANLDQTARAFRQDVIMSMLDEGCIAIVPVETTDNPEETGGYDILSMRVGKILEWYPQHVKVRVYNEWTGEKQDITVPKSTVAIVENPLYAVINEPNSTMQRLIRKLNLLDVVDEQSSSGKLDLIIQLPYVIKTEARRQQAENRRKDIENQLSGSKYGIAYTDGTERITQLNRSVENNLMKQIEFLTSMLYSQLGITQSIMDGTADEKTMLNYNNRTIEPIVSAIVDEMKRKFLTKTARSQSQSIMFFTDPFRLVPVDNIAEIADKFTRNEIMTSNEFRQIIGMKPSDDPRADELRNKNLSEPGGEKTEQIKSQEENQNGEI